MPYYDDQGTKKVIPQGALLKTFFHNLVSRVSLYPPPRAREKRGGEKETLGTRLLL